MKNSRYIYLSIVLTLGCCLLLLAGVGTVQGQDLEDVLREALDNGIEVSQLEELQERSYANGLTAEEVSLLLKPAVSLAGQNLPFDNVMQKAFEGLTKNVPVQRMVPVLNHIESATVTASGIVGPWVAHPQIREMVRRESMSEDRFRMAMIQATSRSIQQDIPPEVAGQLLDEIVERSIPQQSRSSDIVAAVGILPDLSLDGEFARSQALVVRALESGFGTNDLQRLPAAMNVASQRSQLPAASVIEGVSNQLRSGVPASQVLENLFNGNIGNGPPGKMPPGLENKLNRGSSNNAGNGNPGQGN